MEETKYDILNRFYKKNIKFDITKINTNYQYIFNYCENNDYILDNVEVEYLYFIICIKYGKVANYISVNLNIKPIEYDEEFDYNMEYNNNITVINLGNYNLKLSQENVVTIKIDDANKFIKNCFISAFINTIPNIRYCKIKNKFVLRSELENTLDRIKLNTVNFKSNFHKGNNYDVCSICYDLTSTKINNCNHYLCIQCYNKLGNHNCKQLEIITNILCPLCKKNIIEIDKVDDY